MSQLTLLRHGESIWNKENRFTGFVDVELSEKGRSEARAAGEVIRNLPIDFVFTSVLKRAIETADIALRVAGREDSPRIQNAALNERHYGDLQGLDKTEMKAKFGEAQVQLWRRSYDVAPPGGESLKQTCERVIPYYDAEIAPRLMRGENVLIVAHGNSLRGLMKELLRLDENQVVALEIPTGVPISFDIDAKGKATNQIIHMTSETP